MTQEAKFHEDQEVEVKFCHRSQGGWRKAKIVRRLDSPEAYEVLFPDGLTTVFDVEHIRAVNRER